MPEPTAVALFAVAALALIVVPGPAVLYILAQSIHGGRAAGVVSAGGIAVGALVHVAAAVVGLSSLLVSSALAFSIVKYAGAAYLVYLGVRRLLTRVDVAAADVRRERSRRRIFTQGAVVNVLNPKVALFFLAFLPQFVDPDAGGVPLQLLTLGLVWVVLAFVCDCGWALAAGTAGGWLRNSRRALTVERYVSGSVFVGLGGLTALARR